MNLLFWKKWNKPYRNFYVFLLSLFLLSLFALLVSEILRETVVIKWLLFSEIDSIKVAFDSFNQHLLNFTIDSDNFLLRERYRASEVQVYPVFSYIFLFLVIIGMITGLTLFTYMDIVWYIAGMIVFLLFLATLHTELLQVFGQGNHKILIALIILYGGFSYYFHSFNKNFNFFKRLASFAIITVLVGALLAIESEVDHPFLYLANFGIVVPIFISILFFIIISLDIIKAFLFITTDSPNITKKNHRRNFLIITLLYLLNLVLLYLKKTMRIDWDILYFNAYYLFIISAVLGIWSYKKRSVLFKDIIPFGPNGAYYYLSLGIITSATIAFAWITGNDPLAESLEYGIIYTHLCFGVVFFFYVLLNFFDAFNKVSVFKIVYQPRRAPFFMVRGIGFIAVIALFLFGNRFPYYLGLAGYYNLAGDVFKYEGDLVQAKNYYREGVTYEFQNQRSNYSLAALAHSQGQYKEALEHYELASIKRPFEYSFVNLAEIYRHQDMFFPAIFKLRDGVSFYSESPYLNNNLALLYNRTALKDSVFHYLDVARHNSGNPIVPINNFFSVFLQEGFLENADSLTRTKDEKRLHLPFISNSLVLQNALRDSAKSAFMKEQFADSSLYNVNFAYLFNYGLNKARSVNDTIYLETVNKVLAYEENEDYKDDLNLMLALREWYSGDKAEGRNILAGLAGVEGLRNPSYSNMLGLLLMRDRAHLEAAEYFRRLIRLGDQEAYLKYAINMMLTGDNATAKEAFEGLRESHEPSIRRISNNLLMILQTERTSIALTWEEPLRYQFMALKSRELKEQEMLDLYRSFYDANTKKMAAAAMMKYYRLNERPQDALGVFLGFSQENKDNKEINFQYLLALDASGNLGELEKSSSTLSLADENEDYRKYFMARVAENKDEKGKASANYDEAVKRLPFDAKVVITAAEFFQNRNESFKAYEILLRSLMQLPEEIDIIKAYTLQAVRLNLITYAEDTLARLSRLMPQKEFEAFKKEYLLELRKSEREFQQ